MTKKAEIEQKEIEAPYELPEGWKWVTIKDCCETFADGDWIESKDQSNDGIRLIQTGNIGNGFFRDKEDKYHFISEATFKKLNCTEIFSGDILISRLPEPVGRSCIIPELQLKMITAVDCTIVRLLENITNKMWFCYYTQTPSYDELIKSSCTGTTRLRISRNNLGNLPFPLPPVAEQQRIVSRIESMFAKLDEAKEKAQNVVDSFETRKAAILHKAFTGELTANWRKENGVPDDSWKEKKLGECGTIYGGGTPSMSHKEYWENGNILWITSKDMKSDLIEDSEMHVNMKGIDNSSAKYIDKPAVLFVMRSGILRRTFPVCMIKKEFTVNQDLKALVPNDSIILEYLFYVCKSNERKILDTCMKSGTTVESINSDSLFNFMIKIPSLPEQQEIVRILDSVLEKESRAKEAAQTVLDQIALLKKSILARAFRGEL